MRPAFIADDAFFWLLSIKPIAFSNALATSSFFTSLRPVGGHWVE
jgi:hypothetical protein